MPAMTPTTTTRLRLRDISLLLFNHADAWIVTLVVVLMALLIHNAVTWPNLYLMIGITVGYWLAFAMNDYYDAPHDALEPSKAARNFFVRAHPGKLLIGSVIAVLAVLLFPAFAQFGLPGILVVAVSLFFMWAYSAEPLRLKSRPGLDLLTHIVFVETYPYVATLFLIGATWLQVDSVVVVCAMLASLTAQLEQQIRDYDVDIQSGRTFTTVVGIPASARLLRLATVALIIIATIFLLNGTIPLVFLPVALIPLPALLHRLIREPGAPRSQRYVHVAVIMGVLYALFVLGYVLMSA
ncbi:MAG: UbiA family prenyltransferase [Anaerolineae bacterium]|nr:UbiA family prenyltransferase [Anaerolineae bacterium]MCO5194164.1 UbiA family prenyltransferase [Anaerolineae bacterium]